MHKILIILLLVGCGSKQSTMVEVINPAVNPHKNPLVARTVALFEKLSNRQVTTEITFIKKLHHHSVLATCQRNQTKTIKKIKIVKRTWKALSKKCRQVILLHELGHCELDRGHKNEVYNDVPLSIMNSKLKCSKFKDFKHEYLHELIHINDEPLKDAIDNE
jgi:uncharacterized lipoprotein YajG